MMTMTTGPRPKHRPVRAVYVFHRISMLGVHLYPQPGGQKVVDHKFHHVAGRRKTEMITRMKKKEKKEKERPACQVTKA